LVNATSLGFRHCIGASRTETFKKFSDALLETQAGTAKRQ
jgi:hypothetical protein